MMNLEQAARRYGRYSLGNLEWVLLRGFHHVQRVSIGYCLPCGHDGRSLYRLYDDPIETPALCSECLAEYVKACWKKQQIAKKLGWKPGMGWMTCPECQQRRFWFWQRPSPEQDTRLCAECWNNQPASFFEQQEAIIAANRKTNVVPYAEYARRRATREEITR